MKKLFLFLIVNSTIISLYAMDKGTPSLFDTDEITKQLSLYEFLMLNSVKIFDCPLVTQYTHETNNRLEIDLTRDDAPSENNAPSAPTSKKRKRNKISGYISDNDENNENELNNSYLEYCGQIQNYAIKRRIINPEQCRCFYENCGFTFTTQKKLFLHQYKKNHYIMCKNCNSLFFHQKIYIVHITLNTCIPYSSESFINHVKNLTPCVKKFKYKKNYYSRINNNL